jgi:hypothetical protein
MIMCSYCASGEFYIEIIIGETLPCVLFALFSTSETSAVHSGGPAGREQAAIIIILCEIALD